MPKTNLNQTDILEQTLNSIDQYIKLKISPNGPGCSIVVVKNQQPIIRKAIGMANILDKTPLAPEHVFRIASITKTFTSTAILKLMENGKLDISDDITKYLPDYPTKGNKITIKHLLSHTSGIKSYTSLPESSITEIKAKPVTAQNKIDEFKNLPMDFKPGEEFLYNNSGYFLLGAIIEKVSGLTWGEYCKNNFFIPLDMNSTYYDDTQIKLPCTGYTKKINSTSVLPADYLHPSVAYSGGALFSTVDDLWKWTDAIFNYRIISKKTLEEALTPTTLSSGEQKNYGYGWSLSRIDGKKAFGHGGLIDGFLSHFLYIPETQLFISVLCNSHFAPIADIMNNIAYLSIGKPLTDPSIISFDDKLSDNYVGFYQLSKREQILITYDENHFYFHEQWIGERHEIYPYKKDEFFLKNSPRRLKFLRDAHDIVINLEISGIGFINPIAKKIIAFIKVDEFISRKNNSSS